MPEGPAILRGLNVCLVAGTLGGGGAERQLFYALQCLKDQGARPSLLAFEREGQWYRPITDLGIPIRFVGASGSRWARLFCAAKAVCMLRPRLVQSQHFYTNIYSAFSAFISQVPSIGAVRSNGTGEVAANGPILGRLSLATPTYVAANSHFALNALKAQGWSRTRFLFFPNVVDTSGFAPSRNPPSARPFTILGIGRLEPAKRFDRFVEIVAKVAVTTKRPVRAIIAGNGVDRAKLETQVNQARKQNTNISLCGAVADARELYSTADLLLLTSDREGTPNVILEAMACGLPVVATGVGGVPELVRHGDTGFLFDANRLDQGLALVNLLMNNPGLAFRAGREARQYIEKHHSLELLPEILAGMYGYILTRN